MFAIKRMFAGEFDSYLPDHNGEPRLWIDPKDAKAIADCENATAKQNGSHFRYVLERQGEDESWRAREHKRLIHGTYRRHFFASSTYYRNREYNNFHFLHLSQGDPTKVAFTPSEEYGKVDRQKRMKFSRYLERYFPEISDKERRSLIEVHHREYVPSKVYFAWTPDDIEWVYTHGPPSCMAHPTEDYDTSDIHPVRAYGAGDLAIAYTMGNDEDTVRARVLVFPERKIYGRMYGDDASLLRELEDQGYHEDRMGFDGARLLAIEHDEGEFVAPYSDVNAWAYQDRDYLILDSSAGDIKLNDDGGIQRRRPRCERCEDIIPQLDLRHVRTAHGEEEWCPDCMFDHSFRCIQCDERVEDEQANRTAEDELVCDDCAETLPECAVCQQLTLTNFPDPRHHDNYVCDGCYDDAEAEAEAEAQTKEDHHNELETTNA